MDLFYNLKRERMGKGLLLVVVVLTIIAVGVQDIYVDGSLNVWRDGTGNTTSFKVAPEIGYNFNGTWVLGTKLDYSREYVRQIAADLAIITPYIRWSCYQNDAVRLFLDGTAAINFVKIRDGDTTRTGQIGLKLGITARPNNHFPFITGHGFLGYCKNVNTPGDSFGLTLTNENLSIGFHYNL